MKENIIININIKAITDTNDSRHNNALLRILINSIIKESFFKKFFTYFINFTLLKHLNIQNDRCKRVIFTAFKLFNAHKDHTTLKAENPTSITRFETTSIKSSLFQLSLKYPRTPNAVILIIHSPRKKY